MFCHALHRNALALYETEGPALAASVYTLSNACGARVLSKSVRMRAV